MIHGALPSLLGGDLVRVVMPTSIVKVLARREDISQIEWICTYINKLFVVQTAANVIRECL
jgi:hypothetical protein